MESARGGAAGVSGPTQVDPVADDTPAMVSLRILGLSSLWLRSGADPQAARASRALMAVVGYGVLAGVQHAAALAGLLDLGASMVLSALCLIGSIGFYAVIRGGLNERLGGDPSLTLPQLVLAVLSGVGSYAIAGPVRGAVMALLVLVLVFATFALPCRSTRDLALFACALLGAVMVWKGVSDPLRYPPAVEVVHLLCTVILLVFMRAVSAHVETIREGMLRQKSDLDHALEKIRQLARRDELTGLSNRRHMRELMAVEQARQRRTGLPLSVAVLDLDGFKRINDTYGHSGGDLVLKTFAQLTRDALRATDVLGRWGGEAFLLMLPDTDVTDASACVERMRARLARLSADAIAPGLRVTFSAGVAEVQGAEALDAAIERADQAMYRAKVQGRDCTVIA